MKYYPLLLAFIAFSSYSEVEVNPDTHPVIYEGEMLLAEKDSDGFHRAKFFGAEYICFNCTDDFGQDRLKGIWHRNLPEDNNDIYNPKKNQCSSYKLDWRIWGFYVDTYNRSPSVSSSKYNGIYGGCFYEIMDKGIGAIVDIPNTTTIKKITLSENFQPYLLGRKFDFLPNPLVSDKAKYSNLSLPTYQHRQGTETLKLMTEYVPTDKNYASSVFYPVTLREFISPYELHTIDFAKYYTCSKSNVSYFLQTSKGLENICRLNPSLKIVNNKIYLKSEIPDSGGGDSGGGDSGG
ncbi:hypothetical protein JZC40_001803, partial [Salmonella enterica subsp. enterica serovar Moero]|nr:hypothetical protein [Salmonella enterica subsp. enterica serovar Moero]